MRQKVIAQYILDVVITIQYTNDLLLEAKQKLILDWLFAGDPGTRHNEVRANRADNTGKWFYETEQFMSWYQNETPWLWCRGKR